jgi:hypothetical protein
MLHKFHSILVDAPNNDDSDTILCLSEGFASFMIDLRSESFQLEEC